MGRFAILALLVGAQAQQRLYYAERVEIPSCQTLLR